MAAAAGIEDAVGIDLTMASDRQQRTEQVPSDTRLKGRQARRLSENEKTRISMYLRVLNMAVAALSAIFYTAKDKAVILFEIARTNGSNDILYLPAAVAVTSILVTTSLALYAVVLLHQSLVRALAPFLLVNASFFTIHPPPPSPLLQSSRRKLSKTSSSLAPLDTKWSLESVSTSPQARSNALQMEPLPLIDLSTRSSEAGDTPPLSDVLVPEVLSPTQLQLRSLSPAFNASVQRLKEQEVEEILQTSTRPSMPPSFNSMRSRRRGVAPFIFGRPLNAERSMSTVSYPDIPASSGASGDEADSEDKLMRDSIYESEEEAVEQRPPATLSHIDTDGDFDDEEDDEEVDSPLLNVQVEDIPFTSSPSRVGLSITPEVIEVLDLESPRASMDVAPTGADHPAVSTSSPALTPLVPPPSRAATISQEANNVAGPSRDVLSPTPVSFPQPVEDLPFAIPFLREQLQQRLASPPSTSVSQWSSVIAGSDKKDDSGDHMAEPTPYPSPPFTPPSSRPPTMYSSMALPLSRDPAPETLAIPDPFVLERSQLSALVEEAKAELEMAERLTQPMQAPDSAKAEPGAEPDTEPAATPATEAHSESVYNAVVSTEEQVDPTQLPLPESDVAPETSHEVLMPIPTRGILRNPLTHTTQLEQSPPRNISPVKSIGRGGLLDGSRIAVDDFSAESSFASTADSERTLVTSAMEESLNEVGTVAEREDSIKKELYSRRRNSEATSGADDESTAPKAKVDAKKKKKKTKKTKKGVSFDDVPFVIGSDMEQDEDRVAEPVLNDVAAAMAASSPPPMPMPIIPVPKSFEIEEEEEVPTLLPVSPSPEVLSDSPGPSRPLSLVSELLSPRSTADELSDSSAAAAPLAPGEFSPKQVDHYARWFARAHRDKALPTIQALREQMKACTDVELAGRLRLGSRAAPTKLSKVLVGEDNAKGVGVNGVLPPPPVRKGSYGRRR